LQVLTLPSQYRLSLMKFLSHILEIHTFNRTVCGINTRNKLWLHKPTADPTLYQKEGYCMSMKIFTEIPEYIAELVCFYSPTDTHLIQII
jgi:hypothetical protein